MDEHRQTANAFMRGANLGTSMMYMGSIVSFLVRAQETDGRFAMVEYRARPGNEPPPHVHLWEHEIYFVLEGKIEFHCEDQVETVGPGETIFLPAGKAHAFYIRSGYLRTLIITLATTEEPAGLDSYFATMAMPATSMDIPTDAVTYLIDDPSRAIEAGKKYGIRILSPEEARRALPAFPRARRPPRLSVGNQPSRGAANDLPAFAKGPGNGLGGAVDNAAVGVNLMSFN